MKITIIISSSSSSFVVVIIIIIIIIQLNDKTLKMKTPASVRRGSEKDHFRTSMHSLFAIIFNVQFFFFLGGGGLNQTL